MIHSDDPDLEWTVTNRDIRKESGKLKTMVNVSVKHPPSGYAGWALQPNESLARTKALARLNYCRDHQL